MKYVFGNGYPDGLLLDMRQVWRAIVWFGGSDGLYRHASYGFDEEKDAGDYADLERDDIVLCDVVPELVPKRAGLPMPETLKYGFVKDGGPGLRDIYRHVVWYEKDGWHVRNTSMEFIAYGPCFSSLASYKKSLSKKPLFSFICKMSIPACCGFVYGDDYYLEKQ